MLAAYCSYSFVLMVLYMYLSVNGFGCKTHATRVEKTWTIGRALIDMYKKELGTGIE